MIIINGENKILGRLCSFVAKQLLLGENVVIVNCEKILVKKKPKIAFEKYLNMIHRGDPYKGPFVSRRPDFLVKRTIRGMLPWKTNRGREAFKRLKCYISVPEEFKNTHFTEINNAKCDGNYTAISLKEICKRIGYRGE